MLFVHPGQASESHTVPFSSTRVNRVVRALSRRTKTLTREGWLSAVAARVIDARPDLAPELQELLGVAPAAENLLAGLSIGEIGVCYEALLSQMDRTSRKNSGQFFTPDDAARFMAEQSTGFPEGVWLDPCCGVGNLAWHLVGTQEHPHDFIRDRLVLIDRDETALHTAVALIAADYAAEGDVEALTSLCKRAHTRDFLSRAPLPTHDFTIVNPPYARAPERPGYETSSCRDYFAHFIERITKASRGFIAVTPASYLAAPKFQPLRDVLDRKLRGGDVLVFDNVPDTLFRGYKYGSSNTSKTNFVRAAITVCSPHADGWRITQILRWQAAHRATMFAECKGYLAPRRIGPDGEWTKLPGGLLSTWQQLQGVRETLATLVTIEPTEFSLNVGLTPRYFITATYRDLDRGSKATLFFRTAADRDRAALVLNSSVPYIWWRALDGGVTLPRRVLMSTPVPAVEVPDELIARLRDSEERNLVTKLNAGRVNENVKHDPHLVVALNEVVIPEVDRDALQLLYANTLFQ